MKIFEEGCIKRDTHNCSDSSNPNVSNENNNSLTLGSSDNNSKSKNLIEAGQELDQMTKANNSCQLILNCNDPYSVLGISKNANEVAISKAYKNLSYKFLPENNCSILAHDAFDKISLAFQMLTNNKIFSLKKNNRKIEEKIEAELCFKTFLNIKSINADKISTPKKPPYWDGMKKEFRIDYLNANDIEHKRSESDKNDSSDKTEDKVNYSYLSANENYNLKINKKIKHRLPEFMKDNYSYKDEKLLKDDSNFNMNESIFSAGNFKEKKRIEAIKEKLENNRKTKRLLLKIIPIVLIVFYCTLIYILESVSNIYNFLFFRILNSVLIVISLSLRINFFLDLTILAFVLQTHLNKSTQLIMRKRKIIFTEKWKKYT